MPTVTIPVNTVRALGEAHGEDKSSNRWLRHPESPFSHVNVGLPGQDWGFLLFFCCVVSQHLGANSQSKLAAQVPAITPALQPLEKGK